MVSKITALMAENAIKDGAEVKEKRVIERPKEKVTPIPAPGGPSPPQNDDSERHAKVLEASIAQQLIIAQRQAQELSRMVELLAEDKPVRLKVHRNMDRSSPAYLLMEYIDVIPLKFIRKLDS